RDEWVNDDKDEDIHDWITHLNIFLGQKIQEARKDYNFSYLELYANYLRSAPSKGAPEDRTGYIETLSEEYIENIYKRHEQDRKAKLPVESTKVEDPIRVEQSPEVEQPIEVAKAEE